MWRAEPDRSGIVCLAYHGSGGQILLTDGEILLEYGAIFTLFDICNTIFKLFDVG